MAENLRKRLLFQEQWSILALPKLVDSLDTRSEKKKGERQKRRPPTVNKFFNTFFGRHIRVEKISFFILSLPVLRAVLKYFVIANFNRMGFLQNLGASSYLEFQL